MGSLAVLISLIACATLASGAAGARVELTRAHSSRLVGDALRRDMERHAARRLAASGATVSAPTRKDTAMGEYLMTLAIRRRANCARTIRRIMVFETFTFGSSSPANQARVPGIAFGCSNASSDDWNGSAGLVGLGRGRLSLVSQLGAGRFSYCLTPFQDTNRTSTLLLGSSAMLSDAGVGSTPFVANPTMAPMSTYYYLNLTGISLGTKALSISSDAFTLTANGTGGLIIDSGTTITYLVDAAYQQVRAAVLSLVTLPTTDGSDATGLDLCFALPSPASAPPAMPSMTFHFNGADMVLPADSYMILESGLWCLAMQNNTDGEPSILGNYQQQNMHILYDLGQEMLSFAPANCGTF
ncbi:hypothetical protein HU200_034390 [Digitaria exilis]|uniref:Peptidase A1 domain-containing protein n=1 Tax=Digitaria exilis TaxID=1010633 RepID=A0A835BK87_9POAL|nr:hypothetical protein HU200_034390 [Digitaria exilis]